MNFLSNMLSKGTALLPMLMLTGCIIGPFEIEHAPGSVPKLNIDIMIDECKGKVRKDKVYIICDWKF